MIYLLAVLLGLIQGLAEFLPVSSSGHLALFENLLHMDALAAMDDSALFNVLLHLGTLVAVIVAYWQDVRDIIVEFFRMAGEFIAPKKEKKPADVPARRMIWMLIVATLPLVLVVPVHKMIESLNGYTWFIGAALILTGFLLFAADRLPKGDKNEKTIRVSDALVVGLCQAVATIPGLSRSGVTITAGLGRKLERSFAVKFSFLMSLLAVVGAVGLSVLDALADPVDVTLMPAYLLGMAVAGVTGYFSIKLLQKLVSNGRFGGFAYYCWGVGALAVALSFILR